MVHVTGDIKTVMPVVFDETVFEYIVISTVGIFTISNSRVTIRANNIINKLVIPVLVANRDSCVLVIADFISFIDAMLRTITEVQSVTVPLYFRKTAGANIAVLNRGTLAPRSDMNSQSRYIMNHAVFYVHIITSI